MNLVPAEKPQDVYTVVLQVVKTKAWEGWEKLQRRGGTVGVKVVFEAFWGLVGVWVSFLVLDLWISKSSAGARSC